MQCNIKYVGKWDSVDQWYCLTHHAIATDENGNILNECIKNKEIFDNGLKIEKEDIKNILFVYPNLLKNVDGELYVNENKTSGIMYIQDSLFEIRDFGGILLSKLNHVKLEAERCTFCGHIHSDDGRFAFTPHNPHLCAYCGHFFEVKKENVGNELDVVFPIPEINLDNACIDIENVLTLSYDVFKGQVLINGINCNRINLNGKEYSLVEFLNKKLHDQY